MIDPTLTLTLPTSLYTSLQRRARAHQRPLEDEATLTLTLAAAVAAEAVLPADVSAALAALAALDDDTLERVSHSQPTVEDGVLLAALLDTRGRRALTVDEEYMLADLIDRHDRVMVLRAEAVALLQARGRALGERVASA